MAHSKDKQRQGPILWSHFWRGWRWGHWHQFTDLQGPGKLWLNCAESLCQEHYVILIGLSVDWLLIHGLQKLYHDEIPQHWWENSPLRGTIVKDSGTMAPAGTREMTWGLEHLPPLPFNVHLWGVQCRIALTLAPNFLRRGSSSGDQAR